MAVIEYQGTSVDVDDEGYLVDPESWNESVARALSENEGVGELNGDMMDVINFMRAYYRNYNAFPILNSVCKNVHQPDDCVNEEFIDPLSAWKIAGLPNPGDEVIAYLKR